MLAKLSMMPRDSRADTLSTASLNDHNPKLKALYERKKPPTSAEIITALNGTEFAVAFSSTPFDPVKITDGEITALHCFNLLDRLSETDWMLLILLCDKCDVTNSATHTTSNALLYRLAQKLLDKETASAQIKLNAYYFLRSQNQQDIVSPESNITRTILETQDVEAWTALLSNENIQPIIMSDYSLIQKNFDHLLNVYKHMKENSVDATLTETLWNSLFFAFLPAHNDLINILADLITWITKNENEKLAQTIEFLFSHPDAAIKKQLLELALSGAYKLNVLRKALASFAPTPKDIAENPLFNVVFLERHLAISGVSGETTITTSLNTLKNINALFPEKINELFSQFVTPALRAHPEHLLFTAETIFATYPILLRAFAKLASAMALNEPTVIFLSNTSLKLAADWSLEPALHALDIDKEVRGKSEETAAVIRKDLTKAAVRDIIGQLILILTIPNIWDSIVESHADEFTFHLQNILAHDTKDFFRSVSTLPWNQQTHQRICSDKAIDWLFNLNCMRTLSFIQPEDPSFGANGGVYLSNLMTFNDSYIIAKLYAANTSPEFLLFKGLTKIGNYVGIEHVIVPLLTHPAFHIEDYYEHASEQFKQLPQVRAAMQVKYFFFPHLFQFDVDENICNVEIVHDSEVFFQCLNTYYLGNLGFMAQQLSEIDSFDETNEALYQKARAFHKQTKYMSQEYQHTLNQNIGFNAYAFAHRMLKNERVDNPTHHQVSLQAEAKSSARFFAKSVGKLFTGRTLIGKELKTPFLKYILNHLVNHYACSSQNTNYRDAPFIWSAYVEYVKAKRIEQGKRLAEEDTTYSEEKIGKIREWLDRVFESTISTKTIDMLAPLPEDLLRSIFDIPSLNDYVERLLARKIALLNVYEAEDSNPPSASAFSASTIFYNTPSSTSSSYIQSSSKKV